MKLTKAVVHLDKLNVDVDCHLAAIQQIVNPARGTLHAFGCFSNERTIAAISSMFAANTGVIQFPELRDWPDGVLVGEGFTVHKTCLGFDLWHMIALSKSRNFLLNDDDATLWQILRSDMFTTPLLKGWTIHLRDALKGAGLLKPVFSFGCNAACLAVTQDQLDGLVTAGIQRGTLKFLRELAA